MRTACSAILSAAFLVTSLFTPLLQAYDALPKSSSTIQLAKRSLTSILAKAANGEAYPHNPCLVETKIGASSGKPKVAFDLNLSPDELCDEEPPVAATNVAATYKPPETTPKVLYTEGHHYPGTKSSAIPGHSYRDPTREFRTTQPDGVRNSFQNAYSAVDSPNYLSLGLSPSSTGLRENAQSVPQSSTTLRTAMGPELHRTSLTWGAPGTHLQGNVPAGVTRTGLAHQALRPMLTRTESHLPAGDSRTQRPDESDSPPSGIRSAAVMPLTMPLVPAVDKTRDDRMTLNAQPLAGAQGAANMQALPRGESEHSAPQRTIGWMASRQDLNQDPVPSTYEVAADLLSLAFGPSRSHPSQPAQNSDGKMAPIEPDSLGLREQVGKRGRTVPSFADMWKDARSSPRDMGASEPPFVKPSRVPEQPMGPDTDSQMEADWGPLSSNSQPSRSNSPSVEEVLPPKKAFTRKEKRPWSFSEDPHEGQDTSSWQSKRRPGNRSGGVAKAQQEPDANKSTPPSSAGHVSETRERYRTGSAARTPELAPSPKSSKFQPEESSPGANESDTSDQDYSATDDVPISQLSLKKKANAQKTAPASQASSRPVRTKKKVAWREALDYSLSSETKIRDKTRHSRKNKGKAKGAVGTKRKHGDIGDQSELQSSEEDLEAAEVQLESELMKDDMPQVKRKVIRQWEPRDTCWFNPDFYIRIGVAFPPGHTASTGQASKTRKVTAASAISESEMEASEHGLGTSSPEGAAGSAIGLPEVRARGVNAPRTSKLKPISSLEREKFVTGGSPKTLAKPSGKSRRQKQQIASS